jgi:hypothetical protein
VATVEQRVESDVKAGRLWKARDRLAGVIRTDPINQWALNHLGEIYYRMADLPAAGRVWFLTERAGPEWDAALSAFYERYGRKAGDLVSELRVRAPIESFPEAVQERLRTLQEELARYGEKWEPRAGRTMQPVRRTRIRGILSGIAFLVLIGVVLTGLIIGVITIVSALGGLFGWHS